MSVITVFDRSGRRLGEVLQNCDREWVVNEAGDASFSFSAPEEMARYAGRNMAEMLNHGNLVLVEHDTLPPWCGILYMEDWADGIPTYRARGAGWALAKATPTAVQKITGPAGQLWKRILEITNSQVDWKVAPGEIYLGGPQREETLEMVDLERETQRIASRAGNFYDVQPEFSGGLLRLVGNWYGRQGVDSTVRLVEGDNLRLPAGSVMRVSSEVLASDVIGISNGATSASRAAAIARDEESAARWGRRFTSEMFDNVSQQGTAQQNAQDLLEQCKRPERRLRLEVLNVRETFGALRIGNTLPVELIGCGWREDGSGLGWSGRVRVLAMRYEENSDSVALAVEEVRQ